MKETGASELSFGPEQGDQVDRQLMARVQQGDRRAFAELVDRHKDDVVNVIYQVIRDRDRAEDLAQETFLRLYRNRNGYRGDARLAGYLYRIATNLAIDEYRRRKRESRVVVEAPGEVKGRIGNPVAGQLHWPDREVERSEIQALVRRAIEELPEIYRLPVILRDIQGLSYEDVAAVLAIPDGTLKSRLNRARLRLKKQLAPILGRAEKPQRSREVSTEKESDDD